MAAPSPATANPLTLALALALALTLTLSLSLTLTLTPALTPGDFQIFHIADNLSTLDGGATMAALEATQPALAAWYQVRLYYPSYQAMLQLPAVADHLAARPKPGSGKP